MTIEEIEGHAATLPGHSGSSDKVLLEIMFGNEQPTGILSFELPSSMSAVENQKEDLPDDSEAPLFPYGFGFTFESKGDSIYID